MILQGVLREEGCHRMRSIKINGIDVIVGSQGQKRTTVLSLKPGLEFMYKETGNIPCHAG